MLRLFCAAALGPLAMWLLATGFVIMTTPHAHSSEICAGTSGLASWYGTESGNRTADGERFDGSGLTAAMPSRKHLGERYRVHYGHRSVDVRINDVGPATWTHRGIDLSRAAAQRIGLIGRGVGTVCLERLK